MPAESGSAASTDATSGAGATPAKDAQSKSTGAAATAATEATADGSDELGEGGQAAIEREREARREAQRELKEVRAQLKQLTEKDLPEAERQAREMAELRAANAELSKELQTHRVRESVMTTASRLGFADPTDAFRLVDIELDDEGKPKAVEAALKSLLEAKPYLRSSSARAASGGSVDAGNTGGAGAGSGEDMNATIRRMAGRGSN